MNTNFYFIFSMSFFGDKINNSIGILSAFIEAAKTIKPSIDTKQLADDISKNIIIDVDIPQIDLSSIEPYITSTYDAVVSGTPNTSYLVKQLSSLSSAFTTVNTNLKSFSVLLNQVNASVVNSYNAVKTQNATLTSISTKVSDVLDQLSSLLTNLVPCMCNIYVNFNDCCEAYGNLYVYPFYAIVKFYKIIEHKPIIEFGSTKTAMYISNNNIMNSINESENVYLNIPTNTQYMKFNSSHALIISDNTPVSSIIINYEYRFDFIIE